MSSDVEAVLITDEGRLEALEPAWWRLWRLCPTAPPFASPTWALPWWQVFAPGPLRTVAVWSGPDLVALAPFYLERGAHGSRLLPLGIGLSDRLDVLVDPSCAGTAGSLLIEKLLTGPDFDSLCFEELGEDAAASRLPLPVLWLDETAAQSASPLLELGPADNPLVHVPARKRRKLRMGENRVARRGGHIDDVGAEGVPDFIDALCRLHGARWAARDKPGVLRDDRVQEFHRLALPRLVEAGLARLYTLNIEGRLAGAYYGFHDGERAYAYIGGFDPDFAFESPGTVLIAHALAQAAHEGARHFDFLRGQESYKYEWGAVDRWTRRRTFRRSADG